MQLIDKQNRPAAGLFQFLARLVEKLAHLLDTGGDGIDLAKTALGMLGNHVRQRGLSRAWRAVEDERGDPVRQEHAPQQLVRTEKVFLTDEFVQGPWPHACSKGLSLLQVGLVDLSKQIAGRFLCQGIRTHKGGSGAMLSTAASSNEQRAPEAAVESLPPSVTIVRSLLPHYRCCCVSSVQAASCRGNGSSPVMIRADRLRVI